ncbi:effector-associated domain EAD1-containing protein [Archangium violaceum]|uniref:Uncharacterized protein n=1 Tax=Archangium violaceum Cb vi76 TaxID=1406225 RepID=A0A084SN36_9BACT|nr:effector-associated domain EAD1-containing protein [Archangium violaceum]KFA89871.1 hypothetical protein Q664_31970 [Archangium violaceum Cb vi76]
MDLTGPQREKLVEALTKAFPRPAELEQFTLHKLDFPLMENIKEAGVRTMVHELLKYASSQNWLVQLLRQARRVNPGNAELLTLEQDLMPLFSTSQLQQLEALVQDSQLNRARLVQLAHQSVPPGWRPFPEFATDQAAAPLTLFSRLIDSLSSAHRQTDGSHPLLKFIAQLASTLSGTDASGTALAGTLRDWLLQNASGMTVPVPGAAPRRLRGLHLFVKCDSGLRPSVGPEDPVSVTAWLWSIGMDRKPVSEIPELILECTECPLSKVPERLTQIRKSARVLALLEEAGQQMSVEVCLRQNLLSMAVDSWRITVGRTPISLGFKHPVVVRSFERLYLRDSEDFRDILGEWQSKWDQLKMLPGTPAASPLQWIGPEDTGESLVEKLMQPHVLCVVIPRSCEQEVLERSIDAGAPAMLWLRQDGVTLEEAKRCLEPLVSGTLTELPTRVHTARQKTGEEGKLAKHLTLLWDDYDRQPPDVLPFIAPSRS